MSHFYGLMNTEITGKEEINDQETKNLSDAINSVIEQAKDSSADPIVTKTLMFLYKHNLDNDFAKKLWYIVANELDKYSCENSDPEYTDFDDLTEHCEKNYNNAYMSCLKWSNGDIKPISERYKYNLQLVYDSDTKVSFVRYIKNGIPKRNHKSKKVKYDSHCKINKVFKTIGEYAEYIGMTEHPEHSGVFGCFYNIYSIYDSFCIGGDRNINTFIVKSDCKEYSLGCVTWPDDKNEPQPIELPEGYMWVNAARKKDIQWDMMKEIFSKDEAYSGCQDAVSKAKYLVNSKYDLSIDKIDEEAINDIGLSEYVERIDHRIDTFDDDTVLVSIDFHI